MTDTLRERLATHFGFDEFRAGQREVVELLLAGKSAVAVFPTGGGKSLCYQLPALSLEGVTLVVSPLIALMKDQIDALARRGVAARRLDSTLTGEEFRDVVSGLRRGELRLLYVAPERFNNERFRSLVCDVRVSLLAIDEAHCISEWGHNFRPEYLKLAKYANDVRAERILALTATATPPVLEDICRRFSIERSQAISTGFYRANLELRFTPVSAAIRDAALVAALAEAPGRAVIVYVTRQDTAERVARFLDQAGIPARAYHAGMKDERRAEVQDWFMGPEGGAVVATIAFGMGVDKADVRGVYHYNLAKSLESYAQEIGRAGRDGLPSVCHMFVCPDDLNVLENFAYGDTPAPDDVRAFVESLFDRGESFALSLYDDSNRHDIRILVLKTLLTYLELDGYLAGGTSFFAEYRFKPLVSSKVILADEPPEERAFLVSVFKTAKQGRVWFTVDPDAMAETLGTSRERITQALDRLGEREQLEVKASGSRLRFRVVRRPDDLDALAESLNARLAQRERAEVERLAQVLALAGHDGCQTGALTEHFGETRSEPCGHCHWCAKGAIRIPTRNEAEIPEATWQRVEALLADDAAEALRQPRALARFLCGVTSPRLTRARLTRHELFGSMAEIPFPTVLARADG